MSAGPQGAATGMRTVATNGIRLSYTESGTGHPLLLIMGLGAGASAWRPHVQSWDRRFRCIAVDNRGVGGSDVPAGPYSTEMMADDYAGLLEALGTGPTHVVGISMGGAIAQELALRHPHLVERLVLVSTWARCDPYTAEVFDSLAALHEQAERPRFAQLLQLWIWSPAFMAAHFDTLRSERGEPAAITPAAFTAQAAACKNHDTVERLREMAVPTLITAGAADIFVSPSHARQLSEGITGSRLRLFADAGHAHHWEVLDCFNEEVADWLSW